MGRWRLLRSRFGVCGLTSIFANQKVSSEHLTAGLTSIFANQKASSEHFTNNLASIFAFQNLPSESLTADLSSTSNWSDYFDMFSLFIHRH